MSINKSRKSGAASAATEQQKDAKAGSPADARQGSKAATVIALLERESGATIEQMVEATGWQKHSVRGFMAGALKKRHGLTVTSVKTDQGRSYRIPCEAQ